MFVFTFASLQNLRAKFGTLLLYHLISLLGKDELPCSFACFQHYGPVLYSANISGLLSRKVVNIINRD